MAAADSIMSIPTVPISPSAAPANHARRASLKVLSRNIDKVILGNLLFRTWYYSPYPDSVIQGEDHISRNTDTSAGGSATTTRRHSHGANSTNGAQKTAPTVEQTASSISAAARLPSTPCECLHVCPYCFRYTPKVDAYLQHLRRHNVTYNPHVETSSQDSEDIRVDSISSSSSDTSEDTTVWPVPETAVKVYEYNGYTVWDVDGEREKLYCQNLSLFGKLFLEQKSVFFDTSGFHYFVLTYTPPPSPLPTQIPTTNRPGRKRASSSSARSSGRKRTSSGASGIATEQNISTIPTIAPLPPDINLQTRVLGFFSKENLSWDANNLACILVFPPHQHRNLGQLLMAVSYKLSGWEWEDSIIGGPEKPLSAMGRRSYLRFWSERVARYLMGQSADADGRTVFESDDDNNSNDDNAAKSKKKAKRKKKRVGFAREEMTVKQIGDRTGMLAEDVAAALNEMGVLELELPTPTKKVKKQRKSEGDDNNAANATVRPSVEEHPAASMLVHRSRVLEWARGKAVSLVNPVKEEGFLGEWALSEADDGNEGEGSDNEQDIDES